ncbi:hypothetical protein EA187_20005 [Lujinxingia sediminis]|uniref:Uncharacterized protein n=1 Tax=Lujinxingia sediminis TaxID=2480984 RepID=A0ABY0CMM0_9DELT|nr:hypothetical protein [Lujinxingia sediminis]RVU40415.1 hypothetical protein EA187_20005 [Lujinxingia sediminis]
MTRPGSPAHSPPPPPRVLYRLSGALLLAALTTSCGPIEIDAIAPGDPDARWDFYETPIPPEPAEDPYLPPVPDDAAAPLMQEPFVMRLSWEPLIDGPILRDEAVDLDLIACMSPLATSFDAPNRLGCTSWRTPQNQWGIDGAIYRPRAGENATRHGLVEQVGHPILPGQRTHAAVRYIAGGHSVLARVDVYLHGERIWRYRQALIAPGQTWYVALFDWLPHTDTPERFRPLSCLADHTNTCTFDGLHIGDVHLDLSDHENEE